MEKKSQHVRADYRIWKIIGVVFLIVVVVGFIHPFIPGLGEMYWSVFNILLIVFLLGVVAIGGYELFKVVKRKLLDYSSLLLKISQYLKSAVLTQTDSPVVKEKLEKLKHELYEKRRMSVSPFTHGVFQNTYIAFAKLDIFYVRKVVKTKNYRKREYFEKIRAEFNGIVAEKQEIDFDAVIVFDDELQYTLYPNNFLLSASEVLSLPTMMMEPVSKRTETYTLDNMVLRFACEEKEKLTNFITKNRSLFYALEQAGFSGMIVMKNYVFCFYFLVNRFDEDVAVEKVRSSLTNGSLGEVLRVLDALTV